MRCSRCGHVVGAEARFCSNCGQRIKVPPAPVAPPRVAPLRPATVPPLLAMPDPVAPSTRSRGIWLALMLLCLFVGGGWAFLQFTFAGSALTSGNGGAPSISRSSPTPQPTQTARTLVVAQRPKPTGTARTATPEVPATPTLVPPTITPIPSPTGTPTGTPAPALPPLAALYPCSAGLCSVDPGDATVRTVAAFDPVVEALHGYALSADAGQAVYALGSTTSAPGEAVVWLADADGSQRRKLFRIQGVTDGVGAISGFGVLGLSADGTRVIVEHKAQVISVRLDGTNSQASTPRLVAGAASSHTFALSPSRARLLLRPSDLFPRATTYEVATGDERAHDLDPALTPLLFGRDDNHLVASRSDPPYNPALSRGENQARQLVGYVEVDLAGGSSRALQLDNADTPISNVAGSYMVVRRAADTLTYHVFDLASNTRAPVTLPGYTDDGLVALAVPGGSAPPVVPRDTPAPPDVAESQPPAPADGSPAPPAAGGAAPTTPPSAPAAQGSPSIAINPAAGPARMQATIAGQGWPAGTQLGMTLTRDGTYETWTLSVVITDDAGRFQAVFDDFGTYVDGSPAPPGRYTVTVATFDDALTATASVELTPGQ